LPERWTSTRPSVSTISALKPGVMGGCWFITRLRARP
jgi:hypothetical protein